MTVRTNTVEAVKKAPQKRAGASAGKVILNIIMLIFSLSCIFPVIWLFYSSLKSEAEFNANPIALPTSIHLGNYVSIITESKMFLWLRNSAVVTVISLFFIIMCGFIIGYFLSRFKFRGKRALSLFFLAGMIIPIHALMVPIYILFKDAGLLNHWYTLIIPYVAFNLPISILLVESYMHSIPQAMEEAAMIDGCGFTRTLFSIILPMCTPVLVTVGIIQFFACWNEFSFALVLIGKEKLMTVPVGLTLFKGQYSVNYPAMMSAMFLSIMPAILLYAGFSKQIIKGMVSGAVKG